MYKGKKIIPIEEISSKDIFFKGTILRKYNAGMNSDKVSKDKNYYDYILVLLPWEDESMLLVNVTENNNKAGSIYTGAVPIDSSNGQMVVNKEGFKHTLGDALTDWYIFIPDSSDL